MPETEDIQLGLSKDITIRPHFTLRPGETSNLTVAEDNSLTLNFEIANSPFESVSQYSLCFEFIDIRKVFPLEGHFPEIGNTGQVEISGLTFHKLLEGAPTDLLGHKWDKDDKNLIFTLSLPDADPMELPSFSLPLDYSMSLQVGELDLLTSKSTNIKVGETKVVEARLGSGFDGFSCKLLIYEQDAGGIPTKWKEEEGKIILK